MNFPSDKSEIIKKACKLISSEKISEAGAGSDDILQN